VSHNTKIVGNGNTSLSHAILKVQNVSNVMDLTKANIIGTSHGATRQISK